MYNPINMKIEDEKRLYERDLREKNKKARYEVRYDFEQSTRKESLAEQDRLAEMSINKISGKRYREELDRGHHILSNEALDGEALLYKKDMFDTNARATQAWHQLSMRNQPGESEAAVPAEQADAPPPKSEQKSASQAGEGASRRSQHPVISTRSQRPGDDAKAAPEIPRSHASGAPRSNAAASAVGPSQRSMKSQPAASVGSKQPSVPGSSASNLPPKSNQQSLGSRREIRTGGFSKLGEEIMQK